MLINSLIQQKGRIVEDLISRCLVEFRGVGEGFAFRGEAGKPPRAKALRGLASLSFPAGVSTFPHAPRHIRYSKPYLESPALISDENPITLLI